MIHDVICSKFVTLQSTLLYLSSLLSALFTISVINVYRILAYLIVTKVKVISRCFFPRIFVNNTNFCGFITLKFVTLSVIVTLMRAF